MIDPTTVFQFQAYLLINKPERIKKSGTAGELEEQLKLFNGNEALLFELKIFNAYIDAEQMFSRKLLAIKRKQKVVRN